MIYPSFYKNVISLLPDQLVEVFGGYLYQIYSKIFSQVRIELPFQIEGLSFPNPVGMPAGWIDDPAKIKVVHDLGAGVIIVKTITLNPKIGNPYPRIIRGKKAMINSLGLPNYGLKWWVENFIPVVSPSVLSIKGDSMLEWELLIDNLEPKADIFELNFSCPNVSNGIMDLKASKDIILNIASITDCKIFLKLSPEYPAEQNLELTNSVRSHICGVSAINTKPVHHPGLGNPAKIGGLSGPPIYSSLISHLRHFREEYPDHSDLPIFASGGISAPKKAWNVLERFQAMPLTLTSFLMQGPTVYSVFLNYIKEVLDAQDRTLADILH